MIDRSTDVGFASSDGVRLHGTQVLPAEPPRALVLFVHGITSDRSEWGVFDRAAEVFAARGVASLRFDYRGHGESHLPSTEITLEGIRRDIVSAWAVLRSEQRSGTNHFMIGSSFGGGLAYHVASTIGGFARAFLLAPVFDYAQDIKKTAPTWKRAVQRKSFIQYSTLKLSPSIVAEAEAFRSIPLESELPATIFHGTKDDDVPIASSRSAAAQHAFLELVEVEGAGHVIAAPGDLDMEEERSWTYVTHVIDQIVERMRLGS
jgi:pimeloyl-ACP methyl ester carboxylesterase